MLVAKQSLSQKIYIKENTEPSPTNKNVQDSIKMTRTALIQLIRDANLKNNTLELSNRMLDDDSVLTIIEELPDCSNITHLSLANNSISDIGIKRILDVLNNTSIDSLNLSQNEISDAGAEHIINFLKININIVKIKLHNNRISDRFLKEISACLETNNIVKTQIKCETAKENVYKIALSTLSPFFQPELSSLMLEYLSEDVLYKTKAYLQATFYPNIIGWCYPKIKEESRLEIENITKYDKSGTLVII